MRSGCELLAVPGVTCIVARNPHSMPRDARILIVSELYEFRGCDIVRGGCPVRAASWSKFV